jgi:hypothetical protein
MTRGTVRDSERNGLLNREDGCNTTSEKVIDPVTPPLEVLSATLIGDVSKCVTTDFFAIGILTFRTSSVSGWTYWSLRWLPARSTGWYPMSVSAFTIRYWLSDLSPVQCDCFVQIGKCLGACLALTCHAHVCIDR